jgi:hypothetical protein
MNDIQRRADNEAWDRRVERRISDINEGIEQGIKGEALAALHGLHLPPDDDPPYDVDDRSDVDDQETLRGKIISRLLQIENTIAENRDLPADVKQKWIRILQQCYPSETNSITLLRDLRRDMNCWRDIDPESALSLLEAAIGAVATMIEIYRRRFYIS